MNCDLNFSLDFVNDDHAEAFVNDVYVGKVTIRVHHGKRKLTFRCNDNPFKNFIPHVRVFDDSTVRSLLANSYVTRELVPVVIRNYLRNYMHLKVEITEDDDEKLAA